MEPLKSDQNSVLLLEDDSSLSELLQRFFEQWGWIVDSSSTVADARSKIETETYDLVLADYLLPDSNGLEIFEDIQRRSPQTKVMLMTGVKDMNVAASAIRKGAVDLLPKPFKLGELEERIEVLMAEKSNLETDESVSGEPEISEWPEDIVGESTAIRKVVRLVQMVAGKEPPVLVTGESGTGKELIARAIHNLSNRSKGSFVAINCGAIPDNLLEDELFGHVKGAYTDARSPRIGKFEEASKGTLFLDEIGEMRPSLQVKLLRVLEDKTFQRLGSNQQFKADFRLIAATNADLQEKLKSGQFRQDLFYRLNVVPIHSPPLRERLSDLPLLANHFLAQFSKQYSEPLKDLDPKTIRMLMQHDWPGNIRELRNAIELGFILSGDRVTILTEDFPTLTENIDAENQPGLLEDLLQLPEEGIDLNQVVNEVERNLITQSLKRTGGNKGKAARLLFLKRTTLVEKLRRMNLLEEFTR
jgi:DNA-binding NtrC family response regulator